MSDQPTSEWTGTVVDQADKELEETVANVLAGLGYDSGTVKRIIHKAINSALAANQEAWDTQFTATMTVLGNTQNQLAAERKAREIAERSAKAWEEDAHRYVTNTENCAKVIQDLNKQLAAERERYSTKSLVGFTREALIQAEREIDQLQKQLAAEEQKSQRHLEAANRLTGENIELEAQLANLK